MDLSKGFQKLDTIHKAKPPPGPQKQPFEPGSSNERANDLSTLEIVGIALGVSCFLLAVFYALGMIAARLFLGEWL